MPGAAPGEVDAGSARFDGGEGRGDGGGDTVVDMQVERVQVGRLVYAWYIHAYAWYVHGMCLVYAGGRGAGRSPGEVEERGVE